MNDDAFENYCSFCLKKLLLSKTKSSCSDCNLNIYCSNKCKVKKKRNKCLLYNLKLKENDSKQHKLECQLTRKLRSSNLRPTRSQRLLLRFLCSESKVNCEINVNLENFDKDILKYFMNGIALMKKYLDPEVLLPNHQNLLLKSCQVLLYVCFSHRFDFFNFLYILVLLVKMFLF